MKTKKNKTRANNNQISNNCWMKLFWCFGVPRPTSHRMSSNAIEIVKWMRITAAMEIVQEYRWENIVSSRSARCSLPNFAASCFLVSFRFVFPLFIQTGGSHVHEIRVTKLNENACSLRVCVFQCCVAKILTSDINSNYFRNVCPTLKLKLMCPEQKRTEKRKNKSLKK